MRLRSLLPLLLALGGAPIAPAQTLVCPPPSSVASHPCDTFHYHVAMYRPDTRQFVELYGIDQFASQLACEHARDMAVKRNLAVAAFLKQKDSQYESDRFGPCHCDMTVDKASSNALNDLQRIGQFRLAEEIKQRVRERLLDNSVPTDSELIHSLYPPPAASALGGAKVVPLPRSTPVASAANTPGDLKLTKTAESNSPATASLDLPLVEIPIAGVAPDVVQTPPPAASPAAPGEPALPEVRVPAESSPSPAPTPAQAVPVPTPAPAPAPAPASPGLVQATPNAVPTVGLAPQPVPEVPSAGDEPLPPTDESAETFISYETERIQNVLKASGAIGDEAVKSKIFEACMQRIQLLSNLRSLIAGSGARSRLATAVRNVKKEPDRLALVAALFGSDMPAHWAPADAKNVVLEADAQLDAEGEKVLRDASGRYSPQQRRRALYTVLAHTQPTEEQQLWLGSVIDALLQ